MVQFPPVHIRLSPENFDLLLSILAQHTQIGELPWLSNAAHDLMDKRLRFSRLRTGSDGRSYVDCFLYETEAAEMIWQLLFAAATPDLPVAPYHTQLGGSLE